MRLGEAGHFAADVRDIQRRSTDIHNQQESRSSRSFSTLKPAGTDSGRTLTLRTVKLSRP
jgi:hypothetical protein